MSKELWKSNRTWTKKTSAYLKRLIIYLFSYKIKKNATINLMNEKKIILRTYDAYGDAIICTPFLRELKKYFPQLEIDLIVSKKNYDFFKDNIYVDNLYIFSPSPTLKEYWMIVTKLRGDYNILIDLWGKISISKIIAIRLLGTKQIFGVSTESSYRHKYYIGTEDLKCYDLVFGQDLRAHHRDRFLDFFNLLGVDIDDSSYDIFYPEVYEKNAVNFIQKRKPYKFIIGFNYKGSRDDNTLPTNYTIRILRLLSATYPDFLIILFFDSSNQNEAHYIKSTLQNDNIVIQFETKKFLEFCALVKQCNLVITTATSTLHVASAFNKYIITLYPNTPYYRSFDPFSTLPIKKIYKNSLKKLTTNDLDTIKNTIQEFYINYQEKNGVSIDGKHP